MKRILIVCGRRLLIICASYLAALICFSLALLVLLALQWLVLPSDSGWSISAVWRNAVSSGPAAVVFIVPAAFLVSALPAAVLAAIAEAFNIRTRWYYLATGAAAAAVGYSALLARSPFFRLALQPETPVFALAGLAFGYVYWFLCGRYAGQWRGKLKRESRSPNKP